MGVWKWGRVVAAAARSKRPRCGHLRAPQCTPPRSSSPAPAGRTTLNPIGAHSMLRIHAVLQGKASKKRDAASRGEGGRSCKQLARTCSVAHEPTRAPPPHTPTCRRAHAHTAHAHTHRVQVRGLGLALLDSPHARKRLLGFGFGGHGSPKRARTCPEFVGNLLEADPTRALDRKHTAPAGVPTHPHTHTTRTAPLH
jgi:hypothetical protein